MSELAVFGYFVVTVMFVVFLIFVGIWMFIFKKANDVRKESFKNFSKGFESDFFKNK